MFALAAIGGVLIGLGTTMAVSAPGYIILGASLTLIAAGMDQYNKHN